MKNRGLLVSAIVIAWWQFAGNGVAGATREIPRVWDEAALADWVTPIAGLNVRPTNMSAKDYYAMAVENLRTYPVYFPGREPDGYWEMLRRVGPQPLIEPEKLTTEADWVKAGQRVFDEADHLHLRSLDSTLIEDTLRTFPDSKMEIVEMVAERDSVVVRCRVSGTHRGAAARASMADSWSASSHREALRGAAHSLVQGSRWNDHGSFNQSG